MSLRRCFEHRSEPSLEQPEKVHLPHTAVGLFLRPPRVKAGMIPCGRDIKNGLIPDDEKLAGAMIKNICYANAKNYMAFPGVK